MKKYLIKIIYAEISALQPSFQRQGKGGSKDIILMAKKTKQA